MIRAASDTSLTTKIRLPSAVLTLAGRSNTRNSISDHEVYQRLGLLTLPKLELIKIFTNTIFNLVSSITHKILTAQFII